MKLSLEQLSSIARGVDRVEQTSDGVQFFRMTEAQKAYYMHYNNIEKANKTKNPIHCLMKVQHLQGLLTISLPCTTVTTDGAETHFMQLLSVTFQISDSKLENEMQRSQRDTESRL